MARLRAVFAVVGQYRGRGKNRAQYVRKSAEALSRLEGIDTVRVDDIERISATPDNAVATTTLTLALLAAGDWAIAIAISPEADVRPDIATAAATKATTALKSFKTGRVEVVQWLDSEAGFSKTQSTENIEATFSLLHQVISRRSHQGREATNLVRAGWTQVEAAEELGVSKQAINQRLQAAGWHAEEAGWALAVNFLQAAHDGVR